MTNKLHLTNRPADDESSVSSLYTDTLVAKEYIQKRFSYSWQSLLHQTQVAAINRVILENKPAKILEIAPGPARLATDLVGVSQGYMLEYSQEMIAVAKERLHSKRLDNVWAIMQGNAFELNLLPSKFDFIYSFRFIRHFHANDRERLLKGICSQLNSNGFLMFDVVDRLTRTIINKNAYPPSSDALPVYDVTYTDEEFRIEMNSFGLEVVSMQPVLRHFWLQSSISYKLDEPFPTFSATCVHLLEKIPSANPLEWIALCRLR